MTKLYFVIFVFFTRQCNLLHLNGDDELRAEVGFEGRLYDLARPPTKNNIDEENYLS